MCRNFLFSVDGEDSFINSNFSELLELCETSRARKLILGLQTKPKIADMTLPGRWYTGGPTMIRNVHISVLYIVQNQVQVHIQLR